MQQQLDRIVDKLDSQAERLTSIEADLKYHVKRTDDLQALAEEFKRYKWMVMGGIVVLGPIVTMVLKLVFKE